MLFNTVTLLFIPEKVSFLYHLSATKSLKSVIKLPGSKSESNRALILHQISNKQFRFSNLSNAEDVVILKKIFEKESKQVYVKESGTALRFLIAYYCITNKNRIITGSESLCKRPVGKLVEALRQLGFKINYSRIQGYPPVEIVPIENKFLKQKATIDASESSQYLSALLMIAPLLPNGIELRLIGKIASEPYLKMTLELMKQAGIVYSEFDGIIKVTRQEFKLTDYKIEGDWSSASVWFQAVAFSDQADLTIHGLKEFSLQGDAVLCDWMHHFGVQTGFYSHGIVLTKIKGSLPSDLELDCSQNPDLAQAMMVTAAVKNVRLRLTGTRNLRIKETDRLEAMRKELVKINARLDIISDDECVLYPSFRFVSDRFATHNDHRMVLAYSPLSVLQPVTIEDPLVVMKSYPSFWDDFKKIGEIN